MYPGTDDLVLSEELATIPGLREQRDQVVVVLAMAPLLCFLPEVVGELLGSGLRPHVAVLLARERNPVCCGGSMKTSTPGLDLTVCEAADVVLVAEITSGGNAAVDRAIKPQLDAQADIPHYLRVELGAADPSAVVYRLDRDRYAEVVRVGPGRPLSLTEPIAVTLDCGCTSVTVRRAIPWWTRQGRCRTPWPVGWIASGRCRYCWHWPCYWAELCC